MPEIGASLRDARMRAGIDISELEAETKIRAKYLRALENEEWASLPGSTYVKSFLRTYADALGLDGRLLVEEFKLRHENLSDVELQPIAPRPGTARDQRRGPRGGAGRGWAIAAAVAVLVVALYLLGTSGGSGGGTASTPDTGATTTTTKAAKPGRPAAGAPRRTAVGLELVATGSVYVCLEAGGRILVPGQVLAAGQRRGPFRARKFRMTLGNGSVILRVNGQARTVPPSANAIGYALTPRGRTPIAAGKLPTCKP